LSVLFLGTLTGSSSHLDTKVLARRTGQQKKRDEPGSEGSRGPYLCVPHLRKPAAIGEKRKKTGDIGSVTEKPRYGSPVRTLDGKRNFPGNRLLNMRVSLNRRGGKTLEKGISRVIPVR